MSVNATLAKERIASADECATLPDKFPCATCYIAGDAEFSEGYA